MSRPAATVLHWQGRKARTRANKLYAVGVADGPWIRLVWDEVGRMERTRVEADPGKLVLVKRTDSMSYAVQAAKEAARAGRGPAWIFNLRNGAMLAEVTS